MHHEASGGTKIGKNDTIMVTVELDGELETLELKSVLELKSGEWLITARLGFLFSKEQEVETEKPFVLDFIPKVRKSCLRKKLS